MTVKKLLTDVELAQELVPVQAGDYCLVATEKRIPFIKVGHRTLRYDLDAVMAALSKRQVKAVASAGRYSKRVLARIS